MQPVYQVNVWQHWLPRANGRVTTQRSAVVTRLQSGCKYEACVNIFDVRSTAGGITAWLLNKNIAIGRDNGARPVYTGRTFWFYPRLLRQSGNQGTVGS